MARLRCEVLERDGALPRVVRDEAGRVLQLYADGPPAGANWLGYINGIGVWATSMQGAITTDAVEVVWLDTPALDEVGVLVGPDRSDALGLFDSPGSAATGEHTEGASSASDRVGEQRRTSVLAWIAAQESQPQDPDEEAPAQRAPCEPLKRLVADEPLDPLPALEGVPRPRAPAAGTLRRELAPEREDTATHIEGFESMLVRRDEADATVEVGAAPSDPLPHEASPPSLAPREDRGPDARWASPPLRPVLLAALALAVAAWMIQAAW